MSWFCQNATATLFGATRKVLAESDASALGNSGVIDTYGGEDPMQLRVTLYTHSGVAPYTLTQRGIGQTANFTGALANRTVNVVVPTTYEVPDGAGGVLKIEALVGGVVSWTEVWYTAALTGKTISAGTHACIVKAANSDGAFGSDGGVQFGAGVTYAPAGMLEDAYVPPDPVTFRKAYAETGGEPSHLIVAFDSAPDNATDADAYSLLDSLGNPVSITSVDQVTLTTYRVNHTAVDLFERCTLTVDESVHSTGFADEATSADWVLLYPNMLVGPPAGWSWRTDSSSFGQPCVVAGGFIFYTYTAKNDASTLQSCRIARVNESTGVLEGDIELFQYPYDSAVHWWSSVFVDPTDERIIVTGSGYNTGDTRPRIIKSAHAYGGSASEWAANDFGSPVSLPGAYVGTITSEGAVGYGAIGISSLGSLLFVGMGRSFGDGYDHVFAFHSIGDGSSRTAAEIVSDGSWSEIAGYPYKKVSEGWIASDPYISKSNVVGSKMAINVTVQTGKSGTDGNQHAGLWGIAVIVVEDMDVPLSLSRVDGTSIPIPIPWGVSTTYDDSVLWADQHFSSQMNPISIFGDTYRVTVHRAYPDANHDMIAHEIAVSEWDSVSGSWQDVYMPYPYSTQVTGYLAVSSHSTVDSLGRYYVSTYGGYSTLLAALYGVVAADNGAFTETTFFEYTTGPTSPVWAELTDIILRSGRTYVPVSISDIVEFAPDAPTDSALSQDGTATCTDNAENETGHKVQFSVDGGAWGDERTVLIAAYTDGVPTEAYGDMTGVTTLQARWAAYNDAGTSAWVESNEVTLGTSRRTHATIRSGGVTIWR